MEADYVQAPFCSVFLVWFWHAKVSGIMDFCFVLVLSEKRGEPFSHCRPELHSFASAQGRFSCLWNTNIKNRDLALLIENIYVHKGHTAGLACWQWLLDALSWSQVLYATLLCTNPCLGHTFLQPVCRDRKVISPCAASLWGVTKVYPWTLPIQTLS